MTNRMRTAVLVDEHPMFLDAVEQVLTRISVDVVGRASSFAEGTTLIDELEPALVVVETVSSDPAADGISWISKVQEQHQDIKVIVLSTTDDAAQINAAFAAGAIAFVVKKADPDDFAVAVRQAYEHSIYLPNSVATLAPEEWVEHGDLTRREVEILCHISEGMSNAELARMLWVTEQTVKFHLSNIYRKLGVSNRTQASRWAQQHGLLPAQPLRIAVS